MMSNDSQMTCGLRRLYDMIGVQGGSKFQHFMHLICFDFSANRPTFK